MKYKSVFQIFCELKWEEIKEFFSSEKGKNILIIIGFFVGIFLLGLFYYIPPIGNLSDKIGVDILNGCPIWLSIFFIGVMYWMLIISVPCAIILLALIGALLYAIFFECPKLFIEWIASNIKEAKEIHKRQFKWRKK